MRAPDKQPALILQHISDGPLATQRAERRGSQARGETKERHRVVLGVAVGVRAVTIQAFMSACRAAGISACLHAWADIVGIVEPLDGGDEHDGKAEQGAPETAPE